LQRAARVRHVERGALQALHHAGCALPHRLWACFDARRREGAECGSDRAVRQSGGGGAGCRAGAARLGFQAVRHHAAGGRADPPPSPACHHYVSYLLATAYGEPYEVLLGALLPCFWIYAEVGRDIHARAGAANPYRAWIDTYAGEEFHAAVRAVIAATDEAAA